MDTFMKTIIALIIGLMLMAASDERTNIYQYELNLINGEKISLKNLREMFC
jgi:hypothetical protein